MTASSALPRPLIGITTHSVEDTQRAALDRFGAACVTEIEKAGGLPLLVPHGIDEATSLALLERLDGLLLTGGGDIATACYGGPPHPGVAGVDGWRDRVEHALALLAAERRVPLLGICRGCQVINVALGGTLHAEVSEVPGTAPHTFYPDHPVDRLSHTVRVVASSHLARLMPEPELWVNSLHHQAIDRLAPGLRAAALAPDGVIEAVELIDHPFGLAVQWHPEALPAQASTRALFTGFIDASRARCASSGSGASRVAGAMLETTRGSHAARQ
jgi:putative glutamine amidotransferase